MKFDVADLADPLFCAIRGVVQSWHRLDLSGWARFWWIVRVLLAAHTVVVVMALAPLGVQLAFVAMGIVQQFLGSNLVACLAEAIEFDD